MTNNEILASQVGQDFQAGKLICTGLFGESQSGNPQFKFVQMVENPNLPKDLGQRLALKAKGLDKSTRSYILSYPVSNEQEREIAMKAYGKLKVIHDYGIDVSQTVGLENPYLGNCQVLRNPTTGMVSSVDGTPIVSRFTLTEGDPQTISVERNGKITAEEAYQVLASQFEFNELSLNRLQSLCGVAENISIDQIING